MHTTSYWKERLQRYKSESETNKTIINGDDKVIPYYNLKDGEQMNVLLVADANKELFYEYSNHKFDKFKSMNCAFTSSQEPCAICQYAWDLHKAGKDEGKSFMKRNHIIAQAINLSANETTPKLFYMPKSIKDMVVAQVINEQISDPTQHVLVIVRGTNKHGSADYSNSFLRVKDIYKLQMVVQPLDLQSVIPVPTHTNETQTWLKKVLG